MRHIAVTLSNGKILRHNIAEKLSLEEYESCFTAIIRALEKERQEKKFKIEKTKKGLDYMTQKDFDRFADVQIISIDFCGVGHYFHNDF